MYYFHPSYIETERISDGRERVEAKACTGERCISSCPYNAKTGEIGDDQIIEEFINSTEIKEIEDYKKELGENFVNLILDEWNSSDISYYHS